MFCCIWTLFNVLSYIVSFTIITYGVYTLIDSYKRRAFLNDICRKCIFVTGCDSGFGRAIATSLDKQGCIVIAGCLTKQGAESLQQESSERLSTVIIDISSTQSIQEAYKTVKDRLPYVGLWGLVNNAGVGGETGPVEFFSREDYEKLYQVNVFGTAEVTRLFLPLLRNSRGRVVNMSSVSGLVAFPNGVPYSTSKFALECFSDCLRRDMLQWDVRVSVVEPSLYRTNLMTSETQAAKARTKWNSLPQALRDAYGEDYLEKCIAAFSEMTEKFASSDLTPVTDAVTHALLSVHPKERYLLNKRSYIYKLLAAIPTALGDKFMIKMLNAPAPKALTYSKTE